MYIPVILAFCAMIMLHHSGEVSDADMINKGPYIHVLGTVQDAGSPQIGCTKPCCLQLYSVPDPTRKVVSLGIVDPASGKNYLIEATPDIVTQLHHMQSESPFNHHDLPDGIFLTHAHIGHYTGLMHLGKEAINAAGVPVYAMPKMAAFLKKNGPWEQLVVNGNIKLQYLSDSLVVSLSNDLSVMPFRVPHRDEYSETVGFLIKGQRKQVLFIPDIDKWHLWSQDFISVLKEVDVALIDGTFYDNTEVGHRDVTEIPHPFIIETMDMCRGLSEHEKGKIKFIHLNHTNPGLRDDSKASRYIKAEGFDLASFGQKIFI